MHCTAILLVHHHHLCTCRVWIPLLQTLALPIFTWRFCGMENACSALLCIMECLCNDVYSQLVDVRWQWCTWDDVNNDIYFSFVFIFVCCFYSCGQFSPSVWPHNPATRFRPPSATVVSAEPLSHGTGTLRCLQKEMATYRHWSVSLWRDPDDVSHCRILSPDKTEWRLISATLCGWRRCFVANQLWFMTCIREEVEEEGWQLLHKISTITLNYTNPNHNLHLMKPLNYTKSL